MPLSCRLCSACLIVFVHLYFLSQLEKAKELVRAAIHAGIMSDLGSGNNIDICVITRQGVDYIRPYQESQYKDNRYACAGLFEWFLRQILKRS